MPYRGTNRWVIRKKVRELADSFTICLYGKVSGYAGSLSESQRLSTVSKLDPDAKEMEWMINHTCFIEDVVIESTLYDFKQISKMNQNCLGGNRFIVTIIPFDLLSVIYSTELRV